MLHFEAGDWVRFSNAAIREKNAPAYYRARVLGTFEDGVGNVLVIVRDALLGYKDVYFSRFLMIATDTPFDLGYREGR